MLILLMITGIAVFLGYPVLYEKYQNFKLNHKTKLWLPPVLWVCAAWLFAILMIIAFLQGMRINTNQLYDSKKVKLQDTYIEFPVIVEDFLPNKQNVVMNDLEQKIGSKETVVLDYGGFKVLVYNDTSNESLVKKSKMIGISQTIEDVNNGAEPIVFPEGIKVGMEITANDLSMKLISSGGIRGDSGITTDGNIEYVIGGKRWVDLSADWLSQANSVTYPVEITLIDNVVISVKMIFIDK